ncbi:MAG: DNA primase [Bacteroidales bacterium]|jgi:DNA primase|nr:DNA primase [Bacteroidales bacterium]
MIDRFTIDRILDSAHIVDVVGEFIQLKKHGANYLGLCPFHNEKTPSFTVSPSKGIFKCFGCGKAGNSANFIKEHESLSYHEALRFLAKKYNIEIEERQQTSEELERQNERERERESLLVVTSYALRQFSENLFNSNEGTAVGLAYFKERGFRQETLLKFELGYSLSEKNAFSRKALDDGYKQEFLVKTGLSIQGDERIFDRFSGRIMFPIHSLSGQPLGFGGRILKTDAKTAKYLNSPESDIYHKSRILYGAFQARRAITREDRCYLVEGYTDVLSLHEAGIENVVASSGTSLTQEQVKLIKRFTPNITILYDGDPAGIKASLRGIDIVLEEGMNVKIVLLPEGEDPDSYSKKVSNEEFRSFLKDNETDFIRFKSRLLMAEADKDPVMKANLIRDIVKSIAVIPEAITRTVYIKECAATLEVGEQLLYSEVGKLLGDKKTGDRNRYTAPGDLPTDVKTPDVKPLKHETASFYSEREIVRLLLKFGTAEFEHSVNAENDNRETVTVTDYIVDEIVSDELDFNDTVCAKIFADFRFHSEQGMVTGDRQFVQHEDPQVSGLAADLLADTYELSRIWEQKQTYVEQEEAKLKDIVCDAVLKFKSDKINIMRKDLMQQLEEAVKADNQEKIILLQKRYSALSTALGEISKKLGGRILL